MISFSGARFRLYFLLAAFLGLTAGFSIAQTPAPAAAPSVPSAPGQTYAVLIGGIAGEDPYGKWYADWLSRFQTYLTTRAKIPAANVTVLSGQDATFDAITAAMGRIAQHAGPQDQLIVLILGHGEINGPVPRLTLAGPDPTAPDFAALLNSFPAKNQVTLNFSASSGDFLKYLSAPGRVNISATSPTEEEEPVFTEFFLRGLESKRADLDKNGTITLLEAFNWSAQQTAEWIARWQSTKPDVAAQKAAPAAPGADDVTYWKASGKETVEIFEKLYAGVPSRQLDPTSDRNAADGPVLLEPPGGKVTADWGNRRVIDEHALLEDCGQGIGVSEITEKGFVPILGQKPGDPGYLAAHTVLGQPAPLTP